MPGKKLWPALAVVLFLGGLSVSQPTDQKIGPPRRPDQRPPITVDEIVDWIMSFDKDKKGKVTKADLPERMQYLIEKGDTNKDGALDRDEVRALAAKLQPEVLGADVARSGGFRIGTGGPAGPPGDRKSVV